MYNHLQKYSKDQNILCNKQFEFQTEHAIAQLADQIYEAFEKKRIYFRCVYWFV